MFGVLRRDHEAGGLEAGQPVRLVLFVMLPPPTSTLFPYTTLFRSMNRSRASSFPSIRKMQKRRRRSCASTVLLFSSLGRSEEHTSELQSHSELVCRLLLEKKKTTPPRSIATSARRRGSRSIRSAAR